MVTRQVAVMLDTHSRRGTIVHTNCHHCSTGEKNQNKKGEKPKMETNTNKHHRGAHLREHGEDTCSGRIHCNLAWNDGDTRTDSPQPTGSPHHCCHELLLGTAWCGGELLLNPSHKFMKGERITIATQNVRCLGQGFMGNRKKKELKELFKHTTPATYVLLLQET